MSDAMRAAIHRQIREIERRKRRELAEMLRRLGRGPAERAADVRHRNRNRQWWKKAITAARRLDREHGGAGAEDELSPTAQG